MLTLIVDWTGATVRFDLLAAREWQVAKDLPQWRQRQWALGRLTARVALVLAGAPDARRYEILPDIAGVPIAYGPGGAGGALSLSHAGPLVACTVAPPSIVVGVNVERTDERNAALLRRIASPGEQTWAMRDATIVWTCKEAAFKACHGVPGRLADYRVLRHRRDAASIVPVGPTRPYALRAWIRDDGDAVLTTVSTGARPPIHVDLHPEEAIAILARVR